MAKHETILDATRYWVNYTMNSIPQSLIEKAYPHMEEIDELTPVPKKYECEDCQEEFDEDYFNRDAEERNDYDEPLCSSCGGVIQEEDNYDELPFGLPMWGWMWTLENFDEEWVKDNLETVAECGFRVYESDEIGLFIGIDGAGYDFYEAHWIPLYKARGLQWHEKE